MKQREIIFSFWELIGQLLQPQEGAMSRRNWSFRPCSEQDEKRAIVLWEVQSRPTDHDAAKQSCSDFPPVPQFGGNMHKTWSQKGSSGTGSNSGRW